MLPQNIQTTTENDLQTLVTNQVSEGRSLEYKLQLPGNSDEDKKEFLADVSSFANTIGGDIVYGVKEEGGAAAEIVGITFADPDHEILRIESIISSGLQPRIAHVVHPIRLESGNYVIVIRISKSFLAPHRITFKNQDKFFGRNSAGKYALDVEQLRTAFLQSDAVDQKIRDFHAGRILDIEAGRTPFSLIGQRKIIIHVVPLESFSSRLSFSQDQMETLSRDHTNLPLIRPMYVRDWNTPRVNLDGWVAHSGSSEAGDIANSYLQIFKKGYLESVETRILMGSNNIPAYLIEDETIQHCSRCLSLIRYLGAALPVYIFITLTNVKGMVMGRGDAHRRFLGSESAIKQEILDLPEIVVQDFDEDLVQSLRPSLEMIWNACGIAKSDNYDANGNWIPHR